MRKYVINGWFLSQRTLGIQRVARELLRALDRQASPGLLELLVPRDIEIPWALKNVAIVRRGRVIPLLWEQLVLPFYAATHHRTPVSFCNVVPVLYPGVVCVHDVFYRTMAGIFCHSVRGVLSMAWHRLHYRWAALFARQIWTVSYYSKSEIMRAYHVHAQRIGILFNGWEHILDVPEDDSIFEEFPALKEGNYYFALGSLAEYKNIKWVVESALRYRNIRYVVTGGGMASALSNCLSREIPSNVTFTGFVSDAKMKSLMLRCKALVHPSKAEGFGLPPLEALALGRPILISRRTSLPEIFGSAAHYIENPDDYETVDADALLDFPAGSARPVLEKYTWHHSAEAALAYLLGTSVPGYLSDSRRNVEAADEDATK